LIKDLVVNLSLAVELKRRLPAAWISPASMTVPTLMSH
jgi:hypothetical protein